MGGICSPFQLSDLSFNTVPRPPSARCAQANRRWPCLQKLRGTLIRGAETCKSKFREGFNMESLEEVLISLGIGGMTSQFAQILQSAFGSRMVPPYVVKRLNLKHVRAMLLYGPQGSGKTLIAQSICKFLNAKEPLIINGSDVLDAFQGVSERKIRSLFKAAVENEKKFGAKSDLHIIIFDEIDSIAKVDGMKVLNNIFIIATTNRKELIDEVLLREGRIELHVKVEYPDKQGRLEILDINTRNMRQAFVLDEDVNLQEIACGTDGDCSGSALASLVTRAHSYAVVQAGDRGLGKHVEKDIKVTMNHFLHAIEEVKSRLQESSLEPSKMGMEEMFLRQLSSTNSTEVLHMQQEIARLKEDTSHFQATLASYEEDKAKLEKKFETIRCSVCRMGLE
ncbi:vesicle-fusing ATPase-like isoform X2 [Camellia sinensis]|uniref:vesicle-fusing ATPase-like isoform X2 n=1 Tax=Camellia sinensis TaxID=4442 RepID=UPI00103616C3|nr:vesicle-fusing ATPase-like isoform X2 [Camellia sinensis]